ncbi:hypothetical protein AVEN_76809-1 [Araneus ventricosus]|uniref:Uncharacterized protein n=1 Tax=Araneus ventricosus TaxID=182803 RepID=A0A4Y2N6A6_ARAVE|nr:hypothetical protein AVEN_76809-1 [Araneus ventricosus]
MSLIQLFVPFNYHVSMDRTPSCVPVPAATVLPPREKPQTPGMPMAVVMETGYSTACWGEGKGFISFGADRTEDGSLISLCAAVENEFLTKCA